MAADKHQVLLGIDTGGTYTDAALMAEDRLGEGAAALMAKAKALTTREDLAIGIGEAMRAVLDQSGIAPGDVGLVSLSTTLATNALVEGKGGRVAVVMIGFREADVRRQGLPEALGDDPLILIAGGHDAMGGEAAPFDKAALIEALKGVSADGFAICGHFAVRNPTHEIQARALIREATGRPVTCSHELSAKVGGPRRALTALLNARLIGMIDGLIRAAERLMAESGVAAPLMVVRGDGALISAAIARERPIETILSGPAASLVGAGFLTGSPDAIVSDIGGTTTDIAILKGGRPRLDPEGAEVGGHRTMVEAVAMRTHGLGGDSEIRLDIQSLAPKLLLGPRRVVPVSLLAVRHGAMVHEALDRQLKSTVNGDHDGRFLLPLATVAEPTEPEAAILEALKDGPAPADKVLRTRRHTSAASRLIARGAVMAVDLTPSDAAHVLGAHAAWDRAAAEKAAALFARRRGRDGRAIAPDPETLARRVIDTLVRRSGELVLDATFAEDGFTTPGLAGSVLAQAALNRHSGLVHPRLELTAPLVGLGASAPVYYPRVAELVSARAEIPDHADIANAIGAVVGGVRVRKSATVSSPAEGRFRAHLPRGPEDFTTPEAAEAALAGALAELARDEAMASGVPAPELSTAIDRKEAAADGRMVFIESTLTVTASGRPRLAEGETVPELPPNFSG